MALIAGIRFRHIPAKRFVLSKQTQKIKCRTLKVQSIVIKFNEIEPKFVTLIQLKSKLKSLYSKFTLGDQLSWK